METNVDEKYEYYKELAKKTLDASIRKRDTLELVYKELDNTYLRLMGIFKAVEDEDEDLFKEVIENTSKVLELRTEAYLSFERAKQEVNQNEYALSTY